MNSNTIIIPIYYSVNNERKEINVTSAYSLMLAMDKLLYVHYNPAQIHYLKPQVIIKSLHYIFDGQKCEIKDDETLFEYFRHWVSTEQLGHQNDLCIRQFALWTVEDAIKAGSYLVTQDRIDRMKECRNSLARRLKEDQTVAQMHNMTIHHQ